MYDLESLSKEHRALVEAGESLCVDRYDESLDLAGDPDTEPEVLWFLGLCDEMEVVRVDVAGNESTPPELLNLMTRDPSADVRGEVQENPNCPPA